MPENLFRWRFLAIPRNIRKRRETTTTSRSYSKLHRERAKGYHRNDDTIVDRHDVSKMIVCTRFHLKFRTVTLERWDSEVLRSDLEMNEAVANRFSTLKRTSCSPHNNF